MPEIAGGVLEVGVTDRFEVVVNHPDLHPDEKGCGHIIFSPAQARAFGDLVLRKAEECTNAEACAASLPCVLGRERRVDEDGNTRSFAPPPKHAFEAVIRIGGDDWEYVLRTMAELADHVAEHGPGCAMCSGGAGGCHSIQIEKCDISPDAYHLELRKWAGHL